MPRRKQDSESDCQPESKRSKDADDCEESTESEPDWKTEEKEILLVELERKGWKNIDWTAVQQKIKTKTEEQIKRLSAQLKVQRQVIESTGMIAKNTTPLQVWTEFASQVTDPADSIAAQCIPQAMAVASLEERRYIDTSGDSSPNFHAIYSFLTDLLRGKADIQQLSPLDAMIILEFMDDIQTNLDAEYYIDLQVENVMTKYHSLSSRGKELLYNAVMSSNATSSSSHSNVPPGDQISTNTTPSGVTGATSSTPVMGANTTTTSGTNRSDQPGTVPATGQGTTMAATPDDRPANNLRPLLPRPPPPGERRQFAEDKSSSLNPLKIPPALLNFKMKNPWKSRT